MNHFCLSVRDFIDEKSPNARRARENAFINEHNKLWDDSYNVAAAFLTGKDPTGADLAYTGGLEYEEDGHKKKATGGNYTAGGKRTNVINPLTDIFSRTTEMVPYYNPEILNTLMTNSGQACATSPIFLVMGSYKDNTSGEYTNLAKPVTECISEACKAREEIWAQSETGPNTTDMKEYYLNLMSALETYNKEGKNALGQIYSVGSLEYKLSTQGLIDVNKAFTDEAMKSLMKMDMKYHFMDEEAWNKLKSMDIEGADFTNASSYKISYKNVPTLNEDRELFWKIRNGEIKGKDAEDALEVNKNASAESSKADNSKPDNSKSEDNSKADSKPESNNKSDDSKADNNHTRDTSDLDSILEAANGSSEQESDADYGA